MAKSYRLTFSKRLVGRLTAGFARFGVGNFVVLTTTGRTTGRLRRLPLAPISDSVSQYLVSPYGAVSWVLNARAHPEVTISRGGVDRVARLVEVTGEHPALVKAYYEREPVARRYMDVPGDRDVGDFAEVASRFPVFRIDLVG